MTAQVTYVNAPDGVAHTADTVRRMARLARAGAHTYAIRSLATKIVHDVPSKDIQGELAAIYRWVRDHVRYRFDPLGLEWVQAPARTVKERAGDCDDIAVLIASLVQALGHRTRFQTVGPTKQRQSHVYAQAWDRKQWVTLDPVLEPKQTSTAPRADLGAFGRVAPGATRTYSDKGQPMAGVTKTPSAIRLWQPTVFERSRLLRDHPNPIYRGRGSAGKTQLVRVALWNNSLDPFDLAGLDREPGDLGDLGFNFMKAIGSVAKVASAVGVPGAGTVAMAADIGGKLMPGKKKAAGAVSTATPVAARPAAAPSPYAPRASGASQQVNLAPIVSAALESSRDAIKALSAQNAQAVNAITSLARGQVTASAKPKKKKAKPAKKRQRWDPVARRWVVYQQRGTVGALTPRLHFTLGAQAPGVDLDAARALAVSLVKSIKAKGRRYDQAIARQFQTAAGIEVDGKYGGQTAGAVRYFIGKKPPAPMVRPYAERRYTPPATTITREPTAPATPPAYAPSPSTQAAPRAPVQTSAGSRSVTPSSAPIVISPQPLTRREMAANLVRVVQATIQATGKPPTAPVTGAVTYQRAAGIGQNGKWGPETRAAAARDLGVPDSSLPRSAWDKKPKKPRRAPAPQTAPAPAPTPSAPAVYDPVSSGTRDPGLPMFPGDTGPTDKPIDITTMKAPAPKRDNTPLYVLGLLWWQSRRKRAA